MNEFIITKVLTVKCKTVNRRGGFAHEAQAFIDGEPAEKSRVLWVNRTWEEWPYKTVLQKLADNTDMTVMERKDIAKYIKKMG